MSFLDRYILDEQGNPVIEPDPLKWAKWFEESLKPDNEQRQIADTTFGNIRISTVFLSLPHISKEPGNDDIMLYETMVFAPTPILKRLSELAETDDRSIVMHFLNALGGNEWDIQKRYATKEEAIKGHKAMCVFVETCITKGLLEGVESKEEDGQALT